MQTPCSPNAAPNAWDHTLDYYAEAGLDLFDDLWWHSRAGGVIILPSLVAMARPVSIHWQIDQIIDPSFNHWTINPLPKNVDCWHVHWVCGSIAHALSYLPFQLPFVSYQRWVLGDPRLRIVRITRFKPTHECRRQPENTAADGPKAGHVDGEPGARAPGDDPAATPAGGTGRHRFDRPAGTGPPVE